MNRLLPVQGSIGDGTMGGWNSDIDQLWHHGTQELSQWAPLIPIFCSVYCHVHQGAIQFLLHMKLAVWTNWI